MYGPRQDPHGEAGVVAIFLGALADGEQARIFGDGAQTRDYVYVGDVARATVSAVGQDGGVFNIGTGPRDLGGRALRALPPGRRLDVEAEHAPARLGELQRSVLDPELARSSSGSCRWSGSRTDCARPGSGSEPSRRSRAPRARIESRVDHPLAAPDALVRPWRLAAFIAGAIAAVELLILLVIGGGALVGPSRIASSSRPESTRSRPATESRSRSTARKPAAAAGRSARGRRPSSWC